MPQLNIQKVRTEDDRTLPIFEEFEKLADRIRLEAYNLFAGRGAHEGRALDDWLTAEREVCWPAAELSERDGAFVLNVALAGFDPAELKVTATPREIMVKASHEHKEESTGKEEQKLRWSEFRSNDVFRRVELPSAVDVDKISAKYENGLLEIVAPQAESKTQAATDIKVSTGS
jgi:HSP20 family protein